MALILTLLVAVILTVVVLEFNYMMRVHATLSGNLADDLKVETDARAGVEMAKAILLNDMTDDIKEGFLIDSLDEEWAEEIAIEEQTAEIQTVITDEMAKFNLNRLVNKVTAESETEALNLYMIDNVRRLFELLELDPNLVYGIVDWIDRNDDEEPFGAEALHYKLLDPPITCKNGPLDSLEELLYIEGFDAEILYGEGELPGLEEFVTVCGKEDGRININTARAEVVAAALNSESAASIVLEMRNASPFKDRTDLTTRMPDVDLATKFTTRSSFFRVTSTARILSDEAVVRKMTLRTLLKRVQEQEEGGEGYLSIDTVFWKMER
jgi:general secretion pathway protein K